jgi:hypothetical protein
MDWVKWVIPLIAVTVYLLSHLLSLRQETLRRQQAQRPLPPVPLTDEEVAHERERSGQREVDAHAQGRHNELEQRREDARGRRESLDAPPPRRPLPAKARLPAAPPAPRRVPQPPPLPKQPLITRQVEAPAKVEKQVAVLAAATVRVVLRDRNAVAAAIVLNEVLGPPVALRGSPGRCRVLRIPPGNPPTSPRSPAS